MTDRVYQVPIHCKATRIVMIPAGSAAEAKRKALAHDAPEYGTGALEVTYGAEWAGQVTRTDEDPIDWTPKDTP